MKLRKFFHAQIGQGQAGYGGVPRFHVRRDGRLFLDESDSFATNYLVELGHSNHLEQCHEAFFHKMAYSNTAPASQKLGVKITEDGIHIEADGVGTFNRTWDQLAGVIDCDEGILVYFTDKVVNWLPRRVFPESKTKTELYSYLRQRLLD